MDEPLPAPSLSLILTSLHGPAKYRPVLELLRDAARDGDEIVILAGAGGAADEAECARHGIRLVVDSGASVFALRTRLAQVCTRDWLVLVEDHALPAPGAIAALRDLIRTNPALEAVPFLLLNRTSTGRWGWANFLQTYALFWAPMEGPPPFGVPSNMAMRRTAIGTDAALRTGEWEFDVIPRVFARGNVGISNAVALDHVKRVGMSGALLLNFRNGRVSAGVARALLRIPRHDMLREVRKVMTARLAATLAPVKRRRTELPPGTHRRIPWLAAAHALGWIVGTYFGAGRSIAKID